MRLQGKVALITGAASGIGHAVAELFASEGATVIASDIASPRSPHSPGIESIKLDVTNEAAWAKGVGEIVAKRGRLDVLINNAGIIAYEPLHELDMKNWLQMIAIDQTGVFLGMKTCADALKASGHGSVINISSIFGTSGGFGTSPAYHAAKGAVRTLTKNVAVHWATEGVRVNSVHPGFIRTPILDQAKGTEVWDAMTAMTPMGRLGEPHEIAAAVAYLASDDASFVTGLELYVDGGYIAR